MIQVKPGVYRDVPMRDYLRFDAVSSHMLSSGWREGYLNPMSLKEAWEGRGGSSDERKPYQKALDIGTTFHLMLLEPETLLREVVLMPDYAKLVIEEVMEAEPTADPEKVTAGVRSRKRYKQLVSEFNSLNRGKTVIEENDLIRVGNMARSCRAHPQAQQLLGSSGDPEVCLVWEDPETGFLLKRRSDLRGVELKSTGNLAGFQSSIVAFGYDLQAAMEIDGWAAVGQPIEQMVIIAVESKSPFPTMVAPMSESTIEHGRKRYRQSLNVLKEGVEKGHWPHPQSPTSWDSTNMPKAVFGRKKEST